MYRIVIIFLALLWAQDLGAQAQTTVISFASAPQEINDASELRLHFQLALGSIETIDKIIIGMNSGDDNGRRNLHELVIEQKPDGGYKLAGGQVIHDKVLNFSMAFPTEMLPDNANLFFYAVDRSGNSSTELNYFINQ
jgi:hypothetical protein